MVDNEIGGGARRQGIRHRLSDRLFHWVMAISVIVLGGTAFLPILGIRFEWVPLHWMAGVVLTVSVLFHLYRVFFFHGLSNMVPGTDDIREVARDLRGQNHAGLSRTKFDALQKSYHAAAAATVIVAVVTGLIMLAKIDTTFWRRDPSILSDQAWGIVYVLHGAAAMFLLFLFILHVYFRVLARAPRFPEIDDRGPRAGTREEGLGMNNNLEQAARTRDAFDTIEESYEFMLAYAAQGRKREAGESGGESQIRHYLKRFENALANLDEVLQQGTGEHAGAEFFSRFRRDIAVIRSVLELLLSRSSITSDMIDNTNGLIALRALLTDIFFADQAVLPDRHA